MTFECSEKNDGLTAYLERHPGKSLPASFISVHLQFRSWFIELTPAPPNPSSAPFLLLLQISQPRARKF